MEIMFLKSSDLVSSKKFLRMTVQEVRDPGGSCLNQ